MMRMIVKQLCWFYSVCGWVLTAFALMPLPILAIHAIFTAKADSFGGVSQHFGRQLVYST